MQDDVFMQDPEGMGTFEGRNYIFSKFVLYNSQHTLGAW
jgi:hypothetical protein